ncbi:phage antirepressor KilAC domain-containing protein [Lysinibacillus louembei]|uniref:Phage antirepressor KilAC domain-containing protein n=1 Tax=Lysinibacillus louembei TaxID=1470088 RepID=A0ABZ0RZ58_9BACI|nr:phage antirepressor KilAC domain-containing protein [Lysinibacillus louembei]WPK12289.1 phage antirepressor KilAC domain-containing protein [Lysinibacillus louembei]
MDQLIQTATNEQGEIIVSGRELHEFLGISTKYMDWIKRMFDYGFTENVDFTVFLKNEPDVTAFGGIRKITDHALKLDMAKEISMIQRNEKGKQARQYFLHLERLWNSPEMVIKRAMDFQQQKIIQLETQIQEDKPYTKFGRVVAISDGAVNIGTFAKMIYEKHGINIGRNKLMAWLRDNGYLIRQEGAEKNLPKQRYIENGWFRVRPAIIARTDGDVQKGTPLITGKGQVALLEILYKEFKNEGA